MFRLAPQRVFLSLPPHLPKPQVPVAEFVEHLQFLQPRQFPRATAFGLPGLLDLLDVGVMASHNGECLFHGSVLGTHSQN
jgi:hypothetical protein